MRFSKIKGFLNSWYFAIAIFLVLLPIVIFLSISDDRKISNFVKIDYHILNFFFFVSLIISVSMFFFTNARKKFNKWLYLTNLLFLLYIILYLWKYFNRCILLDDSNIYKNLMIEASYNKFNIFASRRLVYNYLVILNSILAIVSLNVILIFTIKQNSILLGKTNCTFVETFASYLLKIKNNIKDKIFEFLLKLKTLVILSFSKTNFIYIKDFIRVIKCRLKRGSARINLFLNF